MQKEDSKISKHDANEKKTPTGQLSEVMAKYESNKKNCKMHILVKHWKQTNLFHFKMLEMKS